MIENMVKPDDVLLIENEQGEISREFIKQSDTTALSKSMRQVFSLLTSLDPVSIHSMIHDKINQLQFLSANSWSWDELFRVCWAVGSVSGAISQHQENQFLESIVTTDLFQLLQKEEASTENKDQLWVVASCLLYIAGQYPHFLKSHWDFTSFLMHRIFEYMQQEQVGVREMACDAFLKISQGCKEELVISHQLPSGQELSFLEVSLMELGKMTAHLTSQQVVSCLNRYKTSFVINFYIDLFGI
jgi:exportin-1